MPRTTLKQLTYKMLAYGQRFPEVTVGHPWGETTLHVRGKNFLFLRHEGEELSFSVKLPQSAVAALALPFVEPTAYGLGRHGWVTCRLSSVAAGIEDQCLAWLDESYAAVAPKKLAAMVAEKPRRTRA
jgi:predicted DNA-binding protein (MmcQ/YjbR family)